MSKKRPRVIPCLLLQNQGLVKTVRFTNARYLGDPINIVKLFNDKEADELVFLDISATVERRPPDVKYLSAIATECFMPLCYGGGVRNLQEMDALYSAGIEKVAINTRAVDDPTLIGMAAKRFGSQSVVVSVDVKRSVWGRYDVRIGGGRKSTGLEPVAFARRMEAEGAGEILLTSIDRDGTMSGYDGALVKAVAGAVQIPVIACGGAGALRDLCEVVMVHGASAAAAGSLFVFQGPHRAVLISYPTTADLDSEMLRLDSSIPSPV